MRAIYREQRYGCGEDYLFVRLCQVTAEEHQTRRRKKYRESSQRQKAKNREARRQHLNRVALTNFTKNGFNVTLTYDQNPESEEEARRDLRNWMRRVMDAGKKLGADRKSIVYLGVTACGEKKGRWHHHVMVECRGLDRAQRARFREILEDKWTLGTVNADRLNLDNGLEDLVSYYCRHKNGRWYRSRHLEMPVVHRPNDSRWSGKELRKACTDCAEEGYWWECKYPGYQFIRCGVSQKEPLAAGWEDRDLAERGCYVILRRRKGYAKPRT